MCCARSSATSRSRGSPLAHRVNSPKCSPMLCGVSCLKFCPRRTRRRRRRPTSRGRPQGEGDGPTSTPSLDQFTIDLTERARQGHIDPVLGRDAELRQIVDILMRRRQNNPDPDRRSGRREDRRGRRIRAARRRREMSRRRCRTSRFARSIWDCCRPAPASRVSSRIV